MIKLLLVDDNALFRDGVARILKADGRFRIVGQAGNGFEAASATPRLRPDVVLMDLNMPGMAGDEAIREIRRGDPALPIGILTVFESDERVALAFAAGANGYIAKDTTPERLCQALVELAQGLPVSDSRRVPGNPTDRRPTTSIKGGPLKRLTPRELEVLRALATSASYPAIAKQLGISPKTLRNHISNTYHKLEIYDRAQAVILAVQEGISEKGRSAL